MKNILKSLGILLWVGAIIGGTTYAWFYDRETSSDNNFTAGILDMKIRDQDESYGDGVLATWTADDAKPGDEWIFNVPFVHLTKTFDSIDADHLEIACDYQVIEEVPCLDSDTDCHTDLHPDEMAKQMLIEKCMYKENGHCVNCLTGERLNGYDPVNHACVGSLVDENLDWKIEDQDGDGKVSFYDLKNDKLDNLAPVPNLAEPKFEMSVKFDETAGNNFQGDVFDLTMIFVLNQDASQ